MFLFQVNNIHYYTSLKPGIHDTSFASKSPFKKTWIKKTWIQVCVYTMQEILMNTHKFLREIQQTNGISGRRGGCFPLYCIIMYNCTAKEIKLQKEVKVASQATMGCISMKSIRSSIISLVHATVFFLHVGVSSLPAIFAQHVSLWVVIIYIHKLMLIRMLSSDWPISIQVPSKLKKNRMHFYSIQVRSSFLIQVSCMYTRSKNLNSRNLNGVLDAKLASCIPGLTSHWLKLNHMTCNNFNVLWKLTQTWNN